MIKRLFILLFLGLPATPGAAALCGESGGRGIVEDRLQTRLSGNLLQVVLHKHLLTKFPKLHNELEYFFRQMNALNVSDEYFEFLLTKVDKVAREARVIGLDRWFRQLMLQSKTDGTLMNTLAEVVETDRQLSLMKSDEWIDLGSDSYSNTKSFDLLVKRGSTVVRQIEVSDAGFIPKNGSELIDGVVHAAEKANGGAFNRTRMPLLEASIRVKWPFGKDQSTPNGGTRRYSKDGYIVDRDSAGKFSSIDIADQLISKLKSGLDRNTPGLRLLRQINVTNTQGRLVFVLKRDLSGSWVRSPIGSVK